MKIHLFIAMKFFSLIECKFKCCQQIQHKGLFCLICIIRKKSPTSFTILKLHVTKKAWRRWGIRVSSARTGAGFCFAVDVQYKCLALFVKPEPKLNSELLLIELPSSPTFAKPYVGRSNSFSLVFAACLYCFALVICNLSAEIYDFTANVV